MGSSPLLCDNGFHYGYLRIPASGRLAPLCIATHLFLSRSLFGPSQVSLQAMDENQAIPEHSYMVQEEETMAAGGEALREHSSEIAEKDIDMTTLEDGPSKDLTAEHREYLLSRHNTLDLIPLPTMDPADPLNWPSWKV